MITTTNYYEALALARDWILEHEPVVVECDSSCFDKLRDILDTLEDIHYSD